VKTHKSQVVLEGPNGEPLIQKTPDVCGGDACIRNSRIMVWLLVAFKKGGWSEQKLLDNYPDLTPEDLTAAWEYYARYPEEIEEAIRLNEQESDEDE
jgi:uncharacterized protein (DUF433 family)